MAAPHNMPDSIASDARPPRHLDRWHVRRVARLAELTADLPARLMSYGAREETSRAQAYEAVTRALGLGMGARRVELLLPTAHAQRASGSRFREAAAWSTDAGDPNRETSEIDLRRTHTLERWLRDGAACWIAGTSDCRAAQPVWSREHTSSWHRVGETLVLPCCGSPDLGRQSLLGIVLIEGGVAASTWSRELIERAESTAALLSSFLERAIAARRFDTQSELEGQNERLAVLGRVAGSVAHDFNNVLGAIVGFAELLEEDTRGNELAAASVEEIQQAAARGTAMVREVLDFGRSRGPRRCATDLTGVIEELSGMLVRVLGESVRLRIDLPETLPRVEIDRAAFERLMMNLATNARDAIAAMPSATGSFRISGEVCEVSADAFRSQDASRRISRLLEPGRYVRISAADDGCGIRPEVAERLFDRFFTTKAPGAGTGLGLSAAADRMHAWGGAIEWSNSTDSGSKSGTTFHLYFPIG